MGMIATVIAGILEIAGLWFLGSAWYRWGASGEVLYSGGIQSNTGSLRRVDLDLDPSMNPLRMWLSADVVEMERGLTTKYSYVGVSLQLHGRAVVKESAAFTIEPDRDRDGKRNPRQGGTSINFPDFSVAEPGRYQLVASSSDLGPRAAITNLKVEVRRNVKGWDVKRVWWGVGLIVFGGLLQWMFGVPLPGSKPD